MHIQLHLQETILIIFRHTSAPFYQRGIEWCAIFGSVSRRDHEESNPGLGKGIQFAQKVRECIQERSQYIHTKHGSRDISSSHCWQTDSIHQRSYTLAGRHAKLFLNQKKIKLVFRATYGAL